jgi:hypothetical protein
MQSKNLHSAYDSSNALSGFKSHVSIILSSPVPAREALNTEGGIYNSLLIQKSRH